MKNTRKIFGFTIIAVIGLTVLLLTGCPPSDNGDNDFGNYNDENLSTIPKKEDFYIAGDLLQNEGSVTDIIILPNYNKSNGAITVYYNGSPTPPKTAGIYLVTFDVAASGSWKAVTGLSAGKLRIYPADYYIFRSINDLSNYLGHKPDNTPANPYYIVTDIIVFGGANNSGAANSYGSLAYELDHSGKKYVDLDLSGSSITAFRETVTLDSDKITCITLPDNVTDIGSFCGSGANLTEIKIDSANSAYTVENGILYNKNKTILIAYPAGKSGNSFIIPDNVTDIRFGAFSGCTKLTSVVIGKGITGIGNGSFANCNSLVGITIPNSVTSIGENAFSYCKNLTSVDIGNGVTGIGPWTFSSCLNLESIIIPDNVISIGENAFSYCENLTSVVIGNGVTSIGPWTFSSCLNLESIIIPDNVISIGENAFSMCYSLTEITISNNITKIEEASFYECSNLSSIILPKSIIGIGSGAFYKCHNLTSVTIQISIDPMFFSNDTNFPPFDGNLRKIYYDYGRGLGTYTRAQFGENWTKQY